LLPRSSHVLRVLGAVGLPYRALYFNCSPLAPARRPRAAREQVTRHAATQSGFRVVAQMVGPPFYSITQLRNGITDDHRWLVLQPVASLENPEHRAKAQAQEK
jgi:hypothetical protein